MSGFGKWLVTVLATASVLCSAAFAQEEKTGEESAPPSTEKWKPAGQITGAGPMSGEKAAEEKGEGVKDEGSKAGSMKADKAPPAGRWKPAGQVTGPAPTAQVPSRPFIPSPLFSLGEFELDVGGRVQPMVGIVGADADSFSNGDAMSRDGFRLRRARLGVEGQITKRWKYNLELDLVDEFSGGNVLIDAAITWVACRHAWVRAGVGKAPFSRVLLTSSANLQFIERPHWVGRENSVDGYMLDPGRQLGLTVGGTLAFLRWQVGVYNGTLGFSAGNFNNGLMYALRLEGGMGDMGKTEADFERSGLRFAVGLNGYLNQAPAANVRAAGMDAGLKWKGLSVWLEAVWAKAVPDSRPTGTDTIMDETESWGMSAQAGYMLPIDGLDLELAARFAIMDDNVHFDNEGDMWEVTAGVNWYIMRNNLKLMLNYVLKEELHGVDLSNDAVLAMLQLAF